MNKQNKPNCLSDFFKVSMMASGTPAAFQKKISKTAEYGDNTCECSFIEAIEGGMIRRPELNMVCGSMSTDFPMALKAVLEREKTVCADEPFLSRILVNCSSRDQIKALLDHDFVKDGIGKKEFHVVSIHSPKDYEDSNLRKTLTSTVDGHAVSSEDAYDVIEGLDGGYFGDGLPVIVFQVGMIGEGINVRCFNSTIVTTHSDRTAMQQVGRTVREYRVKKGPDAFSKILDGHAGVYAFVENTDDMRNLMLNLNEYGLTSDCYDWGKEIDVSTGSSPADGDSIRDPELNSFKWNDMNIEIVHDIISDDYAKTKTEFTGRLLGMRAETVADFMEAMKNDPEYFKEFGLNAKPTAFDREKFMSEKQGRVGGTQRGIAESLIVEHLDELKGYLDTHRDAATELWSVDRKMVMEEVFANETVAEFFSQAIDDGFATKLAGGVKRGKANIQTPNRIIMEKENNEPCQETSATKSTAAVPRPTPENTSDSSKSMSVGTSLSGAWRWLTSLLRR